MFKRALSMAVAGLIACVTIAVQPASAGHNFEKESRFSEKVKLNIARLGTGTQALVVIKLRDKTKLAGYIDKVSEDSFVVVHPKFGTITSVSYVDVAQVKGHNLSTGAKIAIGVGIGAAIVLVALLIYLNCCTG